VRRIAALLALAAVLAPAGAIAAPRASFNDVEDELMCDTCNVPLDIAQSPRADQERRELRALIAQGLTKQQILDRFRAEYGANVLAEPQGGGASVTVWAVPAAILVAAIAGIALLIPRWRRRRAAPAARDDDAPDLSAADARRLEQDLARYDL
jgi:cytochrome c-type biogenesis protein CcmH/NrfF